VWPGSPHAGGVTEPEKPNRYRSLPEPVRSEDLVETVDVSERPEMETDAEERARFLRSAGGV
jgi:hypothetical protein